MAAAAAGPAGAALSQCPVATPAPTASPVPATIDTPEFHRIVAAVQQGFNVLVIGEVGGVEWLPLSKLK